MDHPVRVAFCPIYFASNGGLFSKSGLPIFVSEEDQQVRGLCDVPYDCGVCSKLGTWLRSFEQDWAISWECENCLKQTARADKGLRRLPGFYQTGRVPESNPHPELEDFDNSDLDPSPLPGCTRCGWQTSFLQLVLRPKT